jgi:hypothetical protein
MAKYLYFNQNMQIFKKSNFPAILDEAGASSGEISDI